MVRWFQVEPEPIKMDPFGTLFLSVYVSEQALIHEIYHAEVAASVFHPHCIATRQSILICSGLLLCFFLFFFSPPLQSLLEDYEQGQSGWNRSAGLMIMMKYLATRLTRAQICPESACYANFPHTSNESKA